MEEYINEEFCKKCIDKCCRIYKDYPEHVKNVIRYDAHKIKIDENWTKEAFKKYGVYPQEVINGYCEYYDNSIGCLIKRENRPIKCRLYACEELKKVMSCNGE